MDKVTLEYPNGKIFWTGTINNFVDNWAAYHVPMETIHKDFPSLKNDIETKGYFCFGGEDLPQFTLRKMH